MLARATAGVAFELTVPLFLNSKFGESGMEYIRAGDVENWGVWNIDGERSRHEVVAG